VTALERILNFGERIATRRRWVRVAFWILSMKARLGFKYWS
jgi:hypothetical protein